MTNLGEEAGMCHQFLLMEPKTIEVPLNGYKLDYKNGKPTQVDKFSVGALAGFEMAMQAFKIGNPWFGDWKMRDKAKITCTGIQDATEPGRNPMPEFEVEIERG